MRLTVIIATRGRPGLLRETVVETLCNIVRGDTTLMICADEDDEETLQSLKHLPGDSRIRISVKPREDSRGEKYDRALTEAPADVYLPAVDYGPIVTPGFDQKIVDAAAIWPDGIGVVYTWMCDEIVPSLQAMTAKFVEKMGYIYSHEYPFWFIDHEIADIASHIGRINIVDVKMDASRRPEKTLRLRDIEFWTKYYDLMVDYRVAKARAILEDLECPDWLKRQLSSWGELTAARSVARNYRVRVVADELERDRGEGGPPDAGYLRAKARAEARLLNA